MADSWPDDVLEEVDEEEEEDIGERGDDARAATGQDREDGDDEPSLPDTEVTMAVAQRFSAVLEEARARMSVLSKMALADAPLQASGTGKYDMFALLVHERRLEDRFGELLKRRNELRGIGNRLRYEETNKELGKVTERLHESSATMGEHLEQDNTATVEDRRKAQRHRMHLEATIDELLGELSVGRYDSLMATVVDHSNQDRMLNDLLEKRAELQGKVRALEKELGADTEHYDREAAVRADTLQQLEQEYRSLKHDVVAKLSYEQAEGLADQESRQGARHSELETLHEATAFHQDTLERGDLVSGKTMAFLTQRKAEMDEKHVEWDAKYAEDYANMCQEVEQLRAQQQKDLARLNELRARWDGDEAAEAARLANAKSDRWRAAAMRQIRTQQTIAANLIRFWWRVHARRKKKKKKKGKKGKKGKKKKKKTF